MWKASQQKWARDQRPPGSRRPTLRLKKRTWPLPGEDGFAPASLDIHHPAAFR
jgi:hypothetical protein